MVWGWNMIQYLICLCIFDHFDNIHASESSEWIALGSGNHNVDMITPVRGLLDKARRPHFDEWHLERVEQVRAARAEA